MAYENKVLWTEGMFLRPQHMQQHDRFHDAQMRHRTRLLQRYGWGISKLELDQQLLDMGTLAIKRCEGILPDGTLFSADSTDGDRLLLQPEEALQNTMVYLALPIALAGADEAELDPDTDSLTRYVCQPLEVKDSNLGHAKQARLNTARLRLQLLTDLSNRQDYALMPLVTIREVSGDGKIQLDEGFIPPLLTIDAHDAIPRFLKETIGLLSHRSEAIAARLTSERAGTSEVADYMLLQLVNRCEGQLRHLQSIRNVHPEALFEALVTLYSEISTFTCRGKRPEKWPAYKHEDLRQCFHELMSELRQSLSMVFEQSAIAIPVQERRYGVRVAPLQDKRLLEDASFVLGIKTAWSKEEVANRMPTIIKAGGVEQLRDLVNLQLPGIRLEPLTVAPSQIPYHSGYTYFQLEKTSENWAHLQRSGGMAFHFSGEIPDLDVELWAIKD